MGSGSKSSELTSSSQSGCAALLLVASSVDINGVMSPGGGSKMFCGSVAASAEDESEAGRSVLLLARVSVDTCGIVSCFSTDLGCEEDVGVFVGSDILSAGWCGCVSESAFGACGGRAGHAALPAECR